MKKAILFFGLLGLGVWLFVQQIFATGIDNIWDAIKSVSIWSFGLYVVLSLLNMAIYTLRWDVILHHHHQGERIPFHKLFLHRIAAYAISYLTPAALTGGEPLRIFYLKQDNVPLAEATSATVIDKILELSIVFLFIVLGIGYAILNGSFPNYGGTILLGGLGVLFVLIFWFYYATIKDIGFLSAVLRGTKLTRIKSFERFEQKVIKIEKKMADFYRGHWTQLAWVIFLSVLTMAFIVFERWLLGLFLGFEMNFSQAFLAATIPEIAYLIPIPGGLGALEQSHGIIFEHLGVPINAFAFVMLIRIRDLIYVLIAVVHSSSYGLKMIKDNLVSGGKS